MMSIEAMKQWLEALESYHGYMEPLTTVFGGPRVPAEQSTTGKVERAITSLHIALEEALAKQEPVAQHNVCIECRNADSWGLPDKPICRECVRNSKWQPLNESSTNPVYTHPQPKREPPKAGDGRDLFYEAVRLLDNAIFAQSGDVVRHDLAAHKEALDFFNHVFTQLDLPPTQPKREPLTDDEIWKNDDIMAANSGYGANFETLREVIRAVEAAHGIKEKNMSIEAMKAVRLVYANTTKHDWPNDIWDAICKAIEEEKQEPVARLHVTETDTYPDIEVEVLDGTTLQPSMSPINVYTTPPPLTGGDDRRHIICLCPDCVAPQPKREWVGLTDEVIEQGQKESWVTKQAWESAVWWAEAKLKELNT